MTSAAAIVSSLAGDRLARKPDLSFSTGPAGDLPIITVDETVRYQKMIGFGATLNEAGMVCLNALDAPARDRVLAALFDPDTGAGYTAVKSPLAACDFSSAGPFYSYDDTPGDTALKRFSIERDLGPDGLITFIRHARRFGDFVIQSPMDFPPDWMMFGLQDGQKHVRPEYRETLARYYARFVQAYAEQGITIDTLCLFNEPDNVWYANETYPEIGELLKSHVGPLFKSLGLSTKIQLSGTAHRPEGIDKLPAALDDPKVREFVDSIAVHGYDWDQFQTVSALHDRYPDLPIWMGEVCYAIISNVPHDGPNKLPVYEFADGEYWGRMIIEDMKHWVSAWVYWNMILDQDGGPWLISEIHGDDDGNSQHPAVIINRQTGEVTYTGLYYYLAHFSKFVRPDAFRIHSAGDIPGLNFVAFQNADGSLVLNILNAGDTTVEYQVAWHRQTIRPGLPAHSITTLLWKPE